MKSRQTQMDGWFLFQVDWYWYSWRGKEWLNDCNIMLLTEKNWCQMEGVTLGGLRGHRVESEGGNKKHARAHTHTAYNDPGGQSRSVAQTCVLRGIRMGPQGVCCLDKRRVKSGIWEQEQAFQENVRNSDQFLDRAPRLAFALLW